MDMKRIKELNMGAETLLRCYHWRRNQETLMLDETMITLIESRKCGR